MAEIRFEWDEEKSRESRAKHGVSFEEAFTVFFDEEALLIPDAEHSSTEERFIILGMSSTLRVLVVCHCYRRSSEVIRIISARKAFRVERRQYFSRWH
ncbi:MAG TPA: BrnT family toxin [Candidatus Krumholzibacteria bacterium]|nr:BrnT family toxin [Candidatus Krumholzibacteria bacterium]